MKSHVVFRSTVTIILGLPVLFICAQLKSVSNTRKTTVHASAVHRELICMHHHYNLSASLCMILLVAHSSRHLDERLYL